jgi:surfactin family lipopeptide synthetase A
MTTVFAQPPEPDMESQRAGESITLRAPSGGELFSQKIYWLNKLAGEIPESNLITDFLRPVERENDYGEIEFVIPEKNSQWILRFTNNSHLSVYVLMVAAAKVVLSNYARSRDVIVGSPAYKASGPHNAISNMVALRSDISKDASFKELLLQVKQTVIEAYANQDFPFDELVELLKLPRSNNRCALFDVVILLENIHDSARVSDLPNDITFSFRIIDGGIEGKAAYNRKLFHLEVIENAISHYLHVLNQVVKDVNIKVDEISLLRESEARRILYEFNDNARDYPVDKTFQELFESQAEKTPQKIAVVCEGAHLVYSQLNERTNQVARLLQKTGTNRRDFVGILEHRGINFLAGMLAIFKAGGAYVPIDPAYPRDRVQYMLSNSEVSTVLTSEPLARAFSDILVGCPQLKNVICFDSANESALDVNAERLNIFGSADFESLPSSNLRAASKSSDPAYMIYTSGSTGLPKGAIVRHDGAINHIYAMLDTLRLNEEVSFLQSAPSSSDISVWQFLVPVVTGGSSVVVDNETVADAKKLFYVIKQQRVSVIELVPAALKNLLDYIYTLPDHDRELSDLKWMMVTGEFVPVELANRWLTIYPKIKVVNCYGPTEASDDITQFILEKPLPPRSKSVPIGKPLANLNLYIVDEKMRLVALGVPGEICVSGIGTGDGYWKNEEKTKQAFVPNPFPGTKGKTIYRTGDLGRWLVNGDIEFFGRIDRQVKVRGFRVELEEIESVLAQHPLVREAIVSVREDSKGEKRLVGYLVLAGGELATTEIREHLKEKLPEYMIPSAFVMLDELPIAPSGKVDRNRLPEPVPGKKVEQSAFKSKSPIEEMLAGLWTQVLKIEEVGAGDNFFDLGGHSLLATQVVSRIRDTFKVEVPLRILFENPTIAELAQSIEEAMESAEGMRAPEMRRVPRDMDLPLSFAQQRLWFLDRLSPGNPFYNLMTAMRLFGKLNVEALERSLSEIVRRHEILRTRFEAVKGKPYQRISPPEPVKLPIISLSHLEEREREEKARLLALEEGARPFDLTRGPMLRVILLKLHEEDHVVLFTLHHIVSDGWSTSVLVGEFAVLYDAYCANKPSPLPELAIQYADFAVWQREWLQAAALEAQLSYWRKQLGGNLPVLQLPTDRPRPAVQTYRGSMHMFELPSEPSKAVKEFSRREGVTLFMTLLAAFQILLHRYSGQDDIVVGADVANRNRSEIEGLIGFFVNMLVMRLDLSGNPTFREVLRRTRQMTLGAITHQDVPFEKLVEELQPKRDLSRTPLFQVVFVLQNTPDETLEISGLTMCPIDVPNDTAKFDMVLSISEDSDRLSGFVEYNTDLFDASTIARFMRHYENVLGQITAEPDQTIADFRLLEEGETRGFDISQFPDADLSQADFESLILKIKTP